MPNPNVSFFGQPQSADLAQIERRKALAQALQQQGMQDIPQQTAGGRVVPIAPTQGLNKMLASALGAFGGVKADEQAQALQQSQQQRQGADMSLLVQALQGRPAQPGGLSEDASGNVTPTDAMAAQTPVQALGQAIPMMGPQTQPLALNAMLGAQQREEQQNFQRQGREDQQAFLRQQAEEARLGRVADFQRQTGAQEEAERRRQAFQDQQRRAGAADQQGLMQMRLDAQRQPQQRQPQVIQTAAGPMVLGDDGNAKPIMGPDGKPVQPSQGRVGPMTATAQKELIETEEAIQGGQAALSLFSQARELNDKAMGFSGAGAVASAGSVLPSFIRPGAIDATQNLDNILQTAALPQLKAIFGGMPTEGERKILLDVQGSSSKPPAVRKEIFDRAERAIQARLKFGTEKVKRLREGTYFSGEGLPSIQMEEQKPEQYAGPERRRAAPLPAGVRVTRLP